MLPRSSGRNQTVERGYIHGYRNREVVQRHQGLRLHQPDDGGADVFVHISAVERAGMRSLNEGQKLSYELERDQRSGKTSAGQLQAS